MSGDAFHFRHMFAKPFFHIGHVRNARHDDEALPAAMMFAQQSLAHHHIVPFHHIGADSQSVDRWGLDRGKLAQPSHCHLQGARDGRGGQGQDMHVSAQSLQAFLMRDSETLLFVDNNKAKITEVRALRQDGMRADDDVHIAFLQSFARRGCFLWRHQPRETPDLEREAGKSFDKTGVVLAC